MIIFNTTQHCNVETQSQPFETMLQQNVATVLLSCGVLKIVIANHPI